MVNQLLYRASLLTDDEESLYLKSAASPTANAVGDAPIGNAVLCTDDQTFLIRQVHSSNSIFVLTPSYTVPDANEDDNAVGAGLNAIAQCTTTLELKPFTASAVNILKARLMQYTGSDSGVQDFSANSSGSGKERLRDDMPLSRAEFEMAWADLCAFELDETAMLPIATSLLGAWKSILSAGTVRGLKLDDSIHIQDIVGLVEEDGFPRNLVEAIVGRLSMDQVVPMEGCEFDDRALASHSLSLG